MENQEIINELLTRGVERIYPSREYLQEKLSKGEKLTIYLGADPTGPTLHLGHVIPMLKLAQFQKLGHKIILLIGDFTAMIGDPDKMSMRVPLTREQVVANAKFYKKQVSKILNFSGNNPAELKYNSKWINKLSMVDIAKLLSNVTYAQTIKRDMFQKRISEGKDLYLSEFLYPVLQGYDSVAMNVDGEIGGNDQTFNMLMGRDLLKKLNDKEKVVISMRLLVDSTGKKMGKTEGNMVSLNEKPDEIFGKVMSWSDDFILPVFELCTTMPLSEIADIKKSLESGVNPRDLKLRLAEKVVAVYYGDKKAKVAKENFLKTFSKGEIPDEIPEIESEKGSLLSECLLKTRLISSKSEWRRLVGENAVGFLESDGKVVKILDFNFKVESSAVFKVGKHRFLKVTTK
jgi:tyrosyl-tRNA synthetase